MFGEQDPARARMRELQRLLGFTQEDEHGAQAVAAKTAAGGRRDSRGRRVDDPLNLGFERRSERGREPDRDARGYRHNKPYDPRRNQGR